MPRSIWALGFVSLFMDMSSEMIHGLLPLFMVSVLGASMTMVGVMEGIADALATITKVFSGSLSDYLGKRKLLALIGYAIAACAKPLLPLAHSIEMVMAGRFLDRIGKGVRDAPRDALIGDICPPDIRGAAFGLRQTLDTIGAVIGPLLALLFMWWLANDLRTVLWIAVIPAFIAVAIFAFGVKEPPCQPGESTKFRLRDIGGVGRAYWLLVLVAVMLAFGRFSEAFLVLKAQASGMSLMLAPLVLVIMNLVYALSAYPIGKLSDGMQRRHLLLVSLIFLIAAEIILGIDHSLWMLSLGAGLWGLHMGFSQGLLAAMVTDATPAQLRGTAYGIFNCAYGIAMMGGSILAGVLWDASGPAATFFTGASFAGAALIGLLLLGFAKR